MKRTQDRPLPQGRISKEAAMGIGGAMGASGLLALY